MANYEHLTNAPIVEALIDFRVNLAKDITLANLAEITKCLPPEYSDIEEKHRISAEFKFDLEKQGEAQAGLAKRSPYGFWCKTRDGSNIAQIRLDGYTFSELKPYSDWDSFSAKAKLIWDLYQEKTQCDVIPRVAVRYINHLNLHLEKGEEFSKYLESPPSVPDGLPQGISNFLYRVKIHNPEEGIAAHVSQALMPSEIPSEIKILLDIDVFKDIGEDVVPDDVWAIFSALREFKNDIFFGYITEDTKELFT